MLEKNEESIKHDTFFEEMYISVYGLVYFTIHKLVKNEQDVIDLVQDTFTSAYQNINKLEKFDESNFKPWVVVIAKNKALDFLKQKKPVLFSDMQRKDDESIDVVDTIHSPPNNIAHMEELKRVVKEIMDSLPEEQRLCLFQYCFLEMSLNEIADYNNMNENTVKSNIRYARQKINKRFKETEYKEYKLYDLSPFLLFAFLLKGIIYESVSSVAAPPINYFWSKHNNSKNEFWNNVKQVFKKGLISLGYSLVFLGTVLFVIDYMNGVDKVPYTNNLSNNNIIDVFDYINLKIFGEDGEGKAIATIIPNDQNQINELLSNVSISLSEDSGLRNGTYIEVTCQIRENFNSSNFELKTYKKKYLVFELL